MASNKNSLNHYLYVPTNMANGLRTGTGSPPDSPEFFTPMSTPEPVFKFSKNKPFSESDVNTRPSKLHLTPDTIVPHIVTQAPSPCSPEQIQTPQIFPSRTNSIDSSDLTSVKLIKGLSITPEPYRKLVHPSETPIRSRIPSTTELSRSCENLKSSTLNRRHLLTRHETKETSHIDVCDSEDEYLVNQYVIKEDIGRGAYGQVKKVFDKQTHEFKAMKIISKRLLKRKAFQRRGFSRGSRASQSSMDEDQGIRKEIAVQKKLDHPCIVSLYEVLDDEMKNEMYLVLEYLERGMVMEVGKSGPISEDKCHKYFVDMLLGVEYLHYQNIIHRDIKPENLLLDDHGRLKIADFGESEDLSTDHHGDQSSHKNVGTPAFYAPELTIASTHVTKSVDVWAMGVTLYCMLYDQLPFEGSTRQEIYSNIQTQEVTFPDKIITSPDVRNLMSLLLDKSADSRISLDGVRNHVWTCRAGPLVSKEENCSEYIEVTEEEVDGAIKSCSTMFAALVIVKMMLQKKSFRVPILAKKLRDRSATDASDKLDSSECLSDPKLTNQISDMFTYPDSGLPKSGAKSLRRQSSVDSPLGDPCLSTEL
ncbi:Calcium/calmodulin-dependent protein kinase kinase 2 isoform X1 [Oopsacas minuta]|uniref:Calcium/calmodulin-dependent protein kinase kinase 2 isoform X1 n=1 Tax=Oopsacas minuta TaxID=111878 RepID=A0AAV7K5R1_9METZ|nr:Calcium/calmodulin-dependent protein kinase kinase 2 isoform X1 [Oopsacas minuta]